MSHVWAVRLLSALLGLLQLAYALLAWMVPESLHVGPVAMSFYPRGMGSGEVAGLAPRAIDVGVSSEELILVLVCALFFVVASMMHEARRLAEDNEGFV